LRRFRNPPGERQGRSSSAPPTRPQAMCHEAIGATSAWVQAGCRRPLVASAFALLALGPRGAASNHQAPFGQPTPERAAVPVLSKMSPEISDAQRPRTSEPSDHPSRDPPPMQINESVPASRVVASGETPATPAPTPLPTLFSASAHFHVAGRAWRFRCRTSWVNVPSASSVQPGVDRRPLLHPRLKRPRPRRDSSGG
jgi:hypothetical protein